MLRPKNVTNQILERLLWYIIWFLGCGPQETFRGCADVCIGQKCPRNPCTLARPFDNSTIEEPITTPKPTTQEPSGQPTATTTTTMSTTTPHIHIPPIYAQICHEAAIKENFYSVVGNQYCVETCQGKEFNNFKTNFYFVISIYFNILRQTNGWM